MLKTSQFLVLLIGFLHFGLVTCHDEVAASVISSANTDHKHLTNLRKQRQSISVYNCPVATSYIKKFTRELDYTAYFQKTDFDFAKAQYVVFKAMNDTLNSSVDQDKISTAVKASDDHFIGFKYIKVTPKKNAVSMSSTCPDTNNLWLDYEGVRVEIQLTYESCTNVKTLTSTVLKETISSLTSLKDQMALIFESNLNVPTGYEFGYLTWANN